MKKILLLTFISIFVFTNLLNAQIPKTLSYQGLLTDMDGKNLANGEYSISFKLYDQASSGVPIWEETQKVSLENGIFNALLGKSVPVNLPFDKQYWLGIKIANDNEMSPRVALTSSAYSLSTQDKAALSVFNYGQTPLIMTDGVETNIHFGNTRFNDNMGYSDGAVTVPYTGLYHFDLYISFPYLYGNEYNIELRVYKNGLLYSQEFIDSYSTDLKLNANDVVTFGVIQHSGSDRELGPFSRLSCHKVY